MQTYMAKEATIKQQWVTIDADGKTLGRLATEIAQRLRGKHKADFTPHVDTGDYVIVINAEKIRVTGNKPKDKMYHHYSGYQSGLKSINFEKLIVKDPAQIIEIAVKGMLPKGPLGRKIFKKLKVYAGSQHPHTSQQPQPLNTEN